MLLVFVLVVVLLIANCLRERERRNGRRVPRVPSAVADEGIPWTKEGFMSQVLSRVRVMVTVMVRVRVRVSARVRLGQI